MAKRKVKTPDTDKYYYGLAAVGRDICLSCPLVECVHAPGARPGDVCPIDGSIPSLAVNGDQHRERRIDRLREIANLLPISYKDVLQQFKVYHATLDNWSKDGFIETELIGRRRYITAVNI